MPAKDITRVVDKGTYSHIYNKGIEDKFLFGDDQDYQVFISYLSEYLTSPADSETTKRTFTVKGRSYRGTPHQPKNYLDRVELIAYSLMPSRFHLILRQVAEKSIESFIRSLCTRYSIYYNKKYHRTGPVFEGPYRSAHVKNATQLLYLSAYIHINSRYSSYLDYTGERQTSWVKPLAALSALSSSEPNYKSFIEKYQFGPKEQELLQGVIRQRRQYPLERRDLAQEPEVVVPDLTSTTGDMRKIASATSKTPQRIPEVMGAAGVFLILLSIGIRNISAQSSPSPLPIAVVSSAPSAEPAMLGQQSDISTELENVMALTDPTALAGPTAIADPTASESPAELVVVKIEDGSPSVNIRKSATTYSEIIGIALEGETFELVSEEVEWYEVKLPDATTGFIVKKYTYLQQTID